MRKRRRIRVPAGGMVWHWLERVRGRGEMLIEPAELPLTVANYARGRMHHALALQTALRETFPRLPGSLRALYRQVIQAAPPMVAVILRNRNVGGCLGHSHLVGSGVARRLAEQTGRQVAEMDLALDNIREWEPRPLAQLAAEAAMPGAGRAQLLQYRFQLALLSVYLHELEHLAFPERPERAVRELSDHLYFEGIDRYAGELQALSPMDRERAA